MTYNGKKYPVFWHTSNQRHRTLQRKNTPVRESDTRFLDVSKVSKTKLAGDLRRYHHFIEFPWLVWFWSLKLWIKLGIIVIKICLSHSRWDRFTSHSLVCNYVLWNGWVLILVMERSNRVLHSPIVYPSHQGCSFIAKSSQYSHSMTAIQGSCEIQSFNFSTWL
jgi:hypothetical protein